ncbi:MAG: hypothetical protein ACLP2P_12990, partial [Desulfobaccales bacterium]
DPLCQISKGYTNSENIPKPTTLAKNIIRINGFLRRRIYINHMAMIMQIVTISLIFRATLYILLGSNIGKLGKIVDSKNDFKTRYDEGNPFNTTEWESG